jgi:hypothetical protein
VLAESFYGSAKSRDFLTVIIDALPNASTVFSGIFGVEIAATVEGKMFLFAHEIIHVEQMYSPFLSAALSPSSLPFEKELGPQHYSVRFWDCSIRVLISGTATLHFPFLGPQHYNVHFWDLSIIVLIFGTAAFHC